LVLAKNFRRRNELEFCCAAEDDDDDDEDADEVDAAAADATAAGFWLSTRLASRSRCFMSRCRCFRSRSSAARMSFSRFLSWSRSLLEPTPSDYTTHHQSRQL